MTLHIFNPSHDEALGFGSPYYVPTKAAQQLATLRCTLPALWADVGDAILITDDCRRPQLDDGLLYVYKRELTPTFLQRVTKISPWGWNAYLRHTLRRCGVGDALLPSDEDLAHLRTLSSRETAVKLLHKLLNHNPKWAGNVCWCATVDEAWAAIKQYSTAMVKSPWSSSGRGVFRVEAENNVIPAHQRITNIIRQFGGVAVEKFYDRVQDFAVELMAEQDGTVAYVGLSVFNTSVGGNYLGNVEGTQEELKQHLNSFFSWSEIEQSIPTLQKCLSQLLGGHYVGPLGVDMMIVCEDGCNKLHPCVEINLRNTMGHVQLFRQKALHGNF